MRKQDNEGDATPVPPAGRGPWSDAHTHVEQREDYAAVLRTRRVQAIVNSQTPTEWQWNVDHFRDNARIAISFGIHPWDSENADLAAVKLLYTQADVIGEIGWDSVWTEVPLSTQQTVFEQQLQFAQTLHKPVIVHTKGMEAQVLAMLKQYPNRYYIHWYSAAAWQTEYLNQGYWFSIGPDVFYDTAIKKLAEGVPWERLLLETDGWASLAWVNQQQHLAPVVAPDDAIGTLWHMAEFIASLRHTTPAAVLSQADRNLHAFLQGTTAS